MASELLVHIHTFVEKSYKVTLAFPYVHQRSIGDQLRRSSLSVVLNFIEGGARKNSKETTQMNNIAYASLKETKYLLFFSYKMKLITITEYTALLSEAEKLSKILYTLVYQKRDR